MPNKKTTHIRYEDRVFAQNLNKTKAFLKSNKNIFFTLADKGNITVAMNVDNYKEKMNILLQDKNTYKVIKRNPLCSLQKHTRQILEKWNELEYLDRKLHKNQITLTDTVLPKIYGLPKIHKSNNPLRPIVSCINSPTYLLAKTVDKILNNSLNKPRSYVKNSLDLIEKISHCNVPEDYILISLDVVSLFTNVPCELLVRSIEKRYHIIRRKYNIPLNDLIEAIKFLMNNTYFLWEGNFYQQIFGTPMGSPPSPQFADLVMTDLEEECLARLDFQPLFYYRYVDDTIMCIPKNKVQHLLTMFNSYNTRLQFTHEKENEGKINFLELTLIRQQNYIITDWYRKETFSGRFLQYNSNHPINQKRAMVYTLVDKAILLSNQQFHKKNLNIVKQFLIDNKYPIKFINGNMKKRLNKIRDKNQDINNNCYNHIVDRRLPLVKIPFVPPIYEKLQYTLKQHYIRTIPTIANNLCNVIVRGKDKNDKLNETNVVYKINCQNCDASYVGETKRQLKCRINEHVRNTQKNDIKFVINQHIETHNHQFDFDKVTILDRENNLKKRLISEMINIKIQKNPINIKEDTKNLSQYYDNVINRLKL